MNIGTGEKIKLLRLERNWTQLEMAQKIRISDSAYSKIEAEITGINLTRLLKIAAIFEIRPELLLPDVVTEDQILKEEIHNLKGKLREMEEKMLKLQEKLIKMYENTG
ncbi:antitoxin HipB [compost metagenome]